MGSFTTIEFFPYYTVSYLRRPNQYIPKMDVTDSIESRDWVVSSPLYSEFQVPNRKASSLDRVFFFFFFFLRPSTQLPVQYLPHPFKFIINLLKPTGYVMHQQFNIQQLYILPTLYSCVLYLSENKQRLVPLTA